MSKSFDTATLSNPQIKATLIAWINDKTAGESTLVANMSTVGQSEIGSVAKPQGCPDGFKDAKWRKCAHIAVKNINGIDREIAKVLAFYAPDLAGEVDTGATEALAALAVNAITGVAMGNADRAAVEVAQQSDAAIVKRDHNLSEVWAQWSDVIKAGCKGKIAKASQGLARAGQQVAVNRRKLGDLGVKGFTKDATPDATKTETKTAPKAKTATVQQVAA